MLGGRQYRANLRGRCVERCERSGNTFRGAPPSSACDHRRPVASQSILIRRLEQRLALASPRFTPFRTPLASLLIHGAVGAVWLSLFVCAFLLGDVYAWATGIAYILYDTVLQAFTGWKTLELLKASPPASASSTPDRIAVVIAAHNEAAVLPSTLQSLMEQTDPPDAIVIADDGSDDDSSRLLVDRFGFHEPAVNHWATSTTIPTLHWLRLARGGKARALNAALDSAGEALHADVVMTVDADTHLDPGAVGAMRNAFSNDRHLVAATGVIAPVCGRSPIARLFEWFQTYEYIRNFLSRYAWMRVDSLLLISGAFAGFRRDALMTVGGFDTHCLVEDYELIHRLMRHSSLHDMGWHTRVIGSALARTEAPSTISAFLKQRRRWFGGFLQTQYWYRAMVGDGRYGNVGRLMLPIKAIDTVQPIFGLTALAVLAVALAQGRYAILIPASAWILAKIAIDLAFHMWSVHLYRRWVGAKTEAHLGYAFLAALAEPFSFQILRHLGAALGWVTFLTRQRHWGKQERLAAIEEYDATDPVRDEN